MTGHDSLPLVSVIINCYNGEKYLENAIASIFKQSYTNWEIIFWDNCSTDRSAQIALTFGEKVKYFLSEKNTSLGEARNKAIKHSTGEYISFIDCDDIWSNTQKLEIQVSLMESNKEFALCYGSIEEVEENMAYFRDVFCVHKSGFIFENLLRQYDVNILTSLIRKSILIDFDLNFDTNIIASEEYCLFMQIASFSPIGVTNQILAQYRVHPSSLTSKSLSILGKERRYTLNKIIEKNPELQKKFKTAFNEAYARADYYDARHFMTDGKNSAAFKLLLKNIFVDWRYCFMAFISLLPSKIWNKVHLLMRNRV